MRFDLRLARALGPTPGGNGGGILDGESVCFYGQKRPRLLRVIDKTRFPASGVLKRSERMRIYTLAGNPMMAKVAEGQISAVFETIGQHPHDVAPGAYLCATAGCPVTDLDGNVLDLLEALKRPADDGRSLRYVVSRNARVHGQLLPLLRPRSRLRRRTD